MIDTELLKASVGALQEDRVNAVIDGFLAGEKSGEEARLALTACQEGMYIVGERFENGTYFVGDLVFAGSLLAAAVEKLKPLLGFGGGACQAGTVVLGTVEGDIHFIGKNLFKTMLEAANFRVIDIGIDQPPRAFAEAAEKYRPEIIGLSGLLTTAVDSMRETVEALKEAGLRKSAKIFIGGSIVNEGICAYIGADDYSRNAYEAVRKCREWMGQR
ncbi:MAG: cobalamin-dependent protein [Clostridiales Family XIII bacterium]|jgi:methanogenic corrinoid protein MtbC1|nr:cobalamin-dependent protein [Clostridiales Family XIII bacterium]